MGSNIHFPFFDKINQFSIQQQDDISRSVLKLLVQNFTDYDAYKLGIINQHGNEIIPYDKLNTRQKRAYTKLIRLCISLKKLINKYPQERYKFKTYYIAMQRLGELRESIDIDGLDQDLIPDIVEKIVDDIIDGEEIDEDAPSVATSAVAGYDKPLIGVQRRWEK